MLKVVPDYLKTKNMCKNTVGKLRFVIKYVLIQCKTEEIWDNVILENGGMLNFLIVTRIKNV